MGSRFVLVSLDLGGCCLVVHTTKASECASSYSPLFENEAV